MREKIKTISLHYLPILILLIGWGLISQMKLVPESMLPSLQSTLVTWASYLLKGDLLKHTGDSLFRWAIGFLLSVLVGTTLGIWMARYRAVRNFFAPLVEITYPIPKPVLIPVFMIWLGIGDSSKIMVIFLGCIIPVVISAFNGTRGVDKYLIWSARNMGTSEGKILWKVIIPSALPDILSGIRTALALSYIMMVVSEMLTANSGLGFLIFFLGESGLYEGLFASVLTVAILGFTADRLYLWMMERVLIWREE
jgi:NitT/TauT family transport system permease protein